MLNRRVLFMGVAAVAVASALPTESAATLYTRRVLNEHANRYIDRLLDYEGGVILRTSTFWQARFTETDQSDAFFVDGETYTGHKLRGKLSTPYYWTTNAVNARFLTITPPTDFDLWLLRLDWHFEQFGVSERRYSEETGRECWQAMYDEGMTPQNAFREEVFCWEPEGPA